MTEPKKRGRPAKAKPVEATTAEPQAIGTLTVKVPNVIFDGQGGFLPVGAKFKPADDYAREVLVARGFAE